MRGYLRAHARLDARRRVCAMDEHRIAAHAERDDYLEARAALLDIDGVRAALRQSRHQQDLQREFGLPDDYFDDAG